MNQALQANDPIANEIIEKGLCKHSYYEFVKASWSIVEPGKRFLPNWHIGLISEYLTAVYLKQIKRLIINNPPRYMKSLLVSVMFPAWVWTQESTTRFISSSYAQSLSTKHSIRRRDIITSMWYQKMWGSTIKLGRDQNLKNEFENTAKGHMIATSVGGAATGKGGDFIIMDDPHNPIQALSDIQREEAIKYFTGTLYSRLDDKENGAIVVVMQRLHEEDLTGFLLDQEEKYEHISIQGIADEKRFYSFPITNIKKEVQEDDVLWSKRESRETILRTRSGMTPIEFEGQYQQNPTKRSGDILKDEWWAYWTELPNRIHSWIMSWDTAFKDKKTSSYVVGQVWCRSYANYYLVDQVRGHWNFPNTVKQFRLLVEKHPYVGPKYVEDKASGPMINDFLKNEIDGILPVPVTDGDKIARVQAVSYLIESGNVFLPMDKVRHSWVDGFLLECKRFPKGKFNDQVDTMSQALMKLKIKEYRNQLGGSASSLGVKTELSKVFI